MITFGRTTFRSICVCVMLLLAATSLYAKKPKPNYNFTHHEELISGYETRDDGTFVPKYFFVEQSLDSLDLSVLVTPHNKLKQCIAGVCFWLDAENHADAVVQKRGSLVIIQMQYVLNGKMSMGKYLYKTPSSKAMVRLKRVGEDIIFYGWKSNRKIGKLNIKSLLSVGNLSDIKIPIMLYAAHEQGSQPVTVEFDY